MYLAVFAECKCCFPLSCSDLIIYRPLTSAAHWLWQQRCFMELFMLPVLHRSVYCRATLFLRAVPFGLIDSFPGLHLKSSLQINEWALIKLCKFCNVMPGFSLAEFPAGWVVNCWAYTAIQLQFQHFYSVLVNAWHGKLRDLANETNNLQLIIMLTPYSKQET